MIILDLKNVLLPRINDRYNKNFSLKNSYRLKKNNLLNEIRIQTQKMPLLESPYYVNIQVGTHLDIDSFIKPLLDSIQESGNIDNDSNILDLRIIKTKLKKTEKNWIKVELGEL
jgi:Holliday junction resolvase RusA-like endonuclease